MGQSRKGDSARTVVRRIGHTPLLFAVVVGLLLTWPTVALADFTLGVFPRRSAALTINAFTPLAEKLQKELGEPVRIVVSRDFAAFWEDLERGRFDIVHYNQYHYLLSKRLHGYRVIAANEEFGSRTIAGALTVRKDSGIRNLADLKGKTIVFGGGRKAFGSYVAPTSVLRSAGLSEGTDYTAEFSKNPPNALLAVFHKGADAGGSGDVVLGLKTVTSKIDTSELTVLARSERFVQLPWAVKGDMTPANEERVRAVLTGLKGDPDGEEILRAARVTNFFAVSDADFVKVREIIKIALDEDM